MARGWARDHEDIAIPEGVTVGGVTRRRGATRSGSRHALGDVWRRFAPSESKESIWFGLQSYRGGQYRDGQAGCAQRSGGSYE